MTGTSNARIHTVNLTHCVPSLVRQAGALELDDANRLFGCSVKADSVPANADTG